MRRRPFATAIAIAFGLLVLVGYFIPALLPLQTLLVHWGIILAGFAVLVGVFNLLSVHLNRIQKKQKGRLYSLLLVFALVAAFLLGLIPPGPTSPYMKFTFDAIIFPVEASLLALLSVTLVYASIRLLRRRVDLMSVIFLAFAVFGLLAMAPLPFGELPIFSDLRSLFVNALTTGGARGILLGVALGTLTTGLRILVGADRPYGGK
jgi:membrane-associated HD superfamily phosphohydrolase